MTITTTTQLELKLTVREIRETVSPTDRPGPRKAAPRVVDTTAVPLSAWGDVIDLATRRAS